MASFEFKELVDKANAAASLGFLDAPFREAVKRSLESSLSLAALIVTGPSGPEYAVERQGGYLEGGGVPRFAERIELAASPLVAPLRVENARNATVSVVRFRVMPDEIVTVLRDTLLMTLAPLIAALLLLVFSASDASGKVPAPDDGIPRPQNAETEKQRNEFEDEFEIPDIAEDVVEKKPSGLYGPDGVLGWEAYLLDRLDSELRRAASFEQDLVLVNIETDTDSDEGFKTFAETIVGFFSFKDLAFKKGEKGAAVILPNIGLDQGLKLAEEFLDKYKGSAGDDAANIEIGLSARAGRLVEADRLLNETAGALDRARKDGRFQIMAFKPDPERYRAFVAQS